MNKKQVNDLVSTLCELSEDVGSHTYQIAQILHSVQKGKLYEIIGYSGFPDFVENSNLPMSYSNATRHTALYGHILRLKYTKAEGVAIVTEFGVTSSYFVLRGLEKKVAISTLRRRRGAGQLPILSFALAPDEIEEVDSTLMEFGMDFHDSGQRSGSSDALLAMVRALKSKRPKAA